MDRRDNPETPGSLTDEQLQRAYEVIALSYKGEEPDRLYREATRCFDSLIEISYGNEAIKEFAHRRSIDMKYLVDGASFVISKMHFNPEGNYYVTLGLPQNISQEELSRRWKKLMLLYHPDRQAGNEEWVTERAKKVNEAYTTLKDETKRYEFDRRLTEQMLNKKFPSTPSQADPFHHHPQRTFSHSSRSEVMSARGNTIRKYMPKILIGVYALIAAGVLGFIYLQNRSSQLEAELAPELPTARSSESRQSAPGAALNSSSAQDNAPAAPAAAPQEMKKTEREEAKSTAEPPSPIQTIKKWFQPKEQKQNIQQKTARGKIDSPSGKKESKAQEGGIPLPVPVGPSSEEPRLSERRDDPQPRHLDTATQPEQKQAQQKDVPKAVQEAKQQILPLQRPEPITRDEVEEFMQKYIRAYTKSDLIEFMSLFSRSAVENNSMSYHDIRNAYRETFSEKINYYKIQNMDIKTDSQPATVSGTYILNRYISSEDRWVKYTGKIVWKLIRENNQIKIISMNYDK